MDNQKKLRFNLVDVIFILILLAGAAFVAMRLGGLDVVSRITGGASPEPYVITYIGIETPDYVVDRLEIGAPVTNDTMDVKLGTLLDYRTGPAQISSAAADGHLVVSDQEGSSTVYLMCRTQASDNGYGVTVNGLDLGVGHTIVVRAGGTKLWMAVYDIQKLSDSPYAE